MLRTLAAQRLRSERWDKLGALFTDLEFMEAVSYRLGAEYLTGTLGEALRLLPGTSRWSAPLAQSKRVMERESHRLQGWDWKKQPAYFFQQLASCSQKLGYCDLARSAEAFLCKRKNSYLRLKWIVSRESSSLRRTFVGHKNTVTAIALAENGQSAISGSDDGTVRVWDLESGEQKLSLNLREIQCVSLFSGGQTAIVVAENTVHVIDLESDREGQTIEIKPIAKAARPSLDYSSIRLVPVAAVTADAWRMVFESREWGIVHVWDLKKNKEIKSLCYPEYRVPPGREDREDERVALSSVAITPDGRTVVAGWVDGRVCKWDQDSGWKAKPLAGHSEHAYALAVTPDGRRIVSGSTDDSIRVWDSQTGRQLLQFRLRVNSMAISADGRRLVTSSFMEDRLQVWDLESGKEECALDGHTGEVFVAAVTPSGRRVVSGSGARENTLLRKRDYSVRVWDLENPGLSSVARRKVRSYRGDTDEILNLALAEDGRLVVTGSLDGTVRTWDLETGEEKSILRGHQEHVNAVAVTPDGSRAISGSSDHTIMVWDLVKGKVMRTLGEISPDSKVGHTDSVISVALMDDGRLGASGSDDETVRVWDLEKGRELLVMGGPFPPSTEIMLNEMRGWRKIFAKIFFGLLRIRLRGLLGEIGRVFGLAITADGQRVVSGATDQLVRLWNLKDGREIYALRGHTGPVASLAITPDGQQCVTCSTDRSIRVWDFMAGREKSILEGHTDGVHGVAMTPDGKRAASASWDETVRIWDLESCKELACFRADAPLRPVALTRDGKEIVVSDECGAMYCLQFVEL